MALGAKTYDRCAWLDRQLCTCSKAGKIDADNHSFADLRTAFFDRLLKPMQAAQLLRINLCAAVPKANLRQARASPHQYGKGARADLGIKRTMIAWPYSIEATCRVGDHARKHIEPSGRTLRICDCLDVLRQRERFDQRHNIDAARLEHSTLGQADFVKFPRFYSLRHRRAWTRQEARAHAISNIAQTQ